jgi:L-Lysine epsilon oxidase N-terminal/L-lysine epsilon oxidase C-terminal domain
MEGTMAERIYRIHPAIGIARVGDADRGGSDFFFIGPEHVGVPANFDVQAGKFNAFKKDGKIKPQAARFRIFEYEKGADGKFRPKGEVKLGDGRTSKITWTAHLANRKASFCKFVGQSGAVATPLFSDYPAENMRNPKITGEDERRNRLELDPGPRSIGGGEQGAKDFSIGRPPLGITTLGELRSDAEGHLIVIGGKGKSDFDPGILRADQAQDGEIVNYANNDSWFDDISDGPVQARIEIDGAAHDADAAWVLVGPPDFAPSVRSYRTMYDTLVDVIVREIPLPADDGLFAGALADVAAMKVAWKPDGTLDGFRPSFTRHIYPILVASASMWRVYERRNQPTNNFHAMLDPAAYDILGGPDSDEGARADVFVKIRDPNTLLDEANRVEPGKMPLILGDYYAQANGRGGRADPAFFHSVSLLQYALLRAWNKGEFERDWTGEPPLQAGVVTSEGLDRAALENVVGGPFFPGIEAGWLFTKAQVYRAPFRLARGAVVGRVPVPVAAGQPAKTRDIKVEAGAFSQQMALPWQADFLDCRSEEHRFPPNITRRIGWWPLQRPDRVFVETAPMRRETWARHEDGSEFGEDYQAMVKKWSTLGYVLGTGTKLFEVDRSPPLVA